MRTLSGIMRAQDRFKRKGVDVASDTQTPVMNTPDGSHDDDGLETKKAGYVLPFVHTTVDAELVTEHGGHCLLLTVDTAGIVTPPLEHLAFYAGLGVLVGVGLVELPVAAAIGLGHVLIGLTRRPGLQVLGEALEEA